MNPNRNHTLKGNTEMEIPINLDVLKALICAGEKPQAQNTCQSVSRLAPNGETHIVVMDRGFVYVGKTRVEGDYVEIVNARNVRVWGTKNGLGELRNGPTDTTKLDDVGTVVAPLRAIIHFIKCTRDW
jgi:hypothetical protein